jgi:homoserine dehydrogenase
LFFSGTLSYIFNNFEGTKTFSDVVAEAKEAGYTEPDPRDDLSGTDVARKVDPVFSQMVIEYHTYSFLFIFLFSLRWTISDFCTLQNT